MIVGVPWYAGTPWAYYDDSNTLAYPQDNGVPAEIPPPPPEATADEQGGPQPYGVAPPGANGPVEGPPPNQPAPPSSSQQQSNEGRHESMGSRQDITEDWAPGAPVYHWVDEDGVDNYGTSVPPQYRSKAEKVGGHLSGIVWTVSPATK